MMLVFSRNIYVRVSFDKKIEISVKDLKALVSTAELYSIGFSILACLPDKSMDQRS